MLTVSQLKYNEKIPQETNQGKSTKKPRKPSNQVKKIMPASQVLRMRLKSLLSGKQDPEKSNAVKERTNSTLECNPKLPFSPSP